MVFFFFSAVYIYVDVCSLVAWCIESACEGECLVSCCLCVVQDDASFGGYFGVAEDDDKISFSCVGDAFDYFGATGWYHGHVKAESS